MQLLKFINLSSAIALQIQIVSTTKRQHVPPVQLLWSNILMLLAQLIKLKRTLPQLQPHVLLSLLVFLEVTLLNFISMQVQLEFLFKQLVSRLVLLVHHPALLPPLPLPHVLKVLEPWQQELPLQLLLHLFLCIELTQLTLSNKNLLT